MARWVYLPRCHAYGSTVLFGIALLNVAFLVFLHTKRTSISDAVAKHPGINCRIDADAKQWNSLQLGRDQQLPIAAGVRAREVDSGRRKGQENEDAALVSTTWWKMKALTTQGRDLSQRNNRLQQITTSKGMDICSNLSKVKLLKHLHALSPGFTESFLWQRVLEELQETFVFSAYYDPRTTFPLIRIIGISSGQYVGPEKQRKYCQIWYPDKQIPKVTPAEYSIVPETHDRSYAASFHTCHLQHSHGIPYAVSLVYEKCQLPNNFLKIRNNNISDVQPTFEYTVCVTPFNFNYNNYHQLVETIETNRLFGAQHFVFYNFSAGKSLDVYLRMYKKENLASIIPWKLPVVVDVWPQDPKVEPEIHYFGQLAALNDCLYRNMFSSRFIVFSDLDEVIVPQQHDNWHEMLNNVTKEWMESDKRNLFPGAYLFQNTFFRIDWPNNPAFNDSSLPVQLKLNTLLKVYREEQIHPWYIRSKYIVRSKIVSMVGVHSILNFIDDSKVTHIPVSKKQALLHHYRRWKDNHQVTPTNPVLDTRMEYFAKKIISSVKDIHEKASRYIG